MKKITVLFALLICATFVFGQSAQKLLQSSEKLNYSIATADDSDRMIEKTTPKNQADEEEIIWPLTGEPFGFENEGVGYTISAINTVPTGYAQWQVSGWDIASQQTYRNYGESHFRGSKCAWINVIEDFEVHGANIKHEGYCLTLTDQIDLDGVAAPILKYYQAFARLNDIQTYVEWREHGSTDWNTIEVNVTVPSNDWYAGNGVREVMLAGAGGKTIDLRFRWETPEPSIGAPYGYHWILDDLYIVEAPEVNMALIDARVNFLSYQYYHDAPASVGNGFHFSSHYGQIPYNLAKDTKNSYFSFFGTITNYSRSSYIPTLKVSIENPDGEMVYEESIARSNALDPARTDTLDLWDYQTADNGFVLGSIGDKLKLGEYKVYFEVFVEGKEDNLPDDNKYTAYFEVTEAMYGRAMSDSIRWDRSQSFSTNGFAKGSQNNDQTGIIFDHMIENDTVFGLVMYFHSNPQSEVSGAKVAFQLHVLNNKDLIKIGDPMVVDVPNGVPDTYTRFEKDFLIPVAIPYDATSIVRLVLTQEYTYNGTYIRFASDRTNKSSAYGTMLHLVNTASEGLWYSLSQVEAPAIFMKTTGKKEVSISPIVDANNKVSVYPNPTTGNLNIKNAEGGTIEVLNIMGQVMETVSNANEIELIDISRYANGNYFVRVIVDGKVSVEKINLVK
jgi:hypothetical protein